MSAAAYTPAPEWRGDEISVLVRHYPSGGTHACLPLLPRRTKCAINSAAKTLGLKREGRKVGSGIRA